MQPLDPYPRACVSSEPMMTRVAVMFALVASWFALAFFSYAQIDSAEAQVADGYGLHGTLPAR